MKILITALLLLSTSAYAGTWKFKCEGAGYNGKTDRFKAIMDTDLNLVFIETASEAYPYIKPGKNESTDLGAIDPRFNRAEFSGNHSIVNVEVTTYNYFSGDIAFYLGKGLDEITKDVDFSIVGDNSVTTDIAVEYDDGDGFGFNKRTYTCKVTRY